MKKSLLSLGMVFISIIGFGQASSQFYFDAGVKGGYGLTLFMNKNIFDDKRVVSEFSVGHSFGGRLGGNFNERHSINVEILSSAFNQSYTIKTDSLSWSKIISFTTLDIALLYRHFVEGTYIEIGPQIAFIQKASENNSITGTADISKELLPNYYAGVFGFGANLMGTENVSLMLGMRATYSLTDVISDLGKSENNSAPLNDAFYKPAYKSYKATNPLTIRIMMELTFDMGYFTNSRCNKKRTRFVTF